MLSSPKFNDQRSYRLRSMPVSCDTEKSPLTSGKSVRIFVRLSLWWSYSKVLGTAEMYSLTLWRPEIWNQGIGGILLLLKVLGRSISCVLSNFFLVVRGTCLTFPVLQPHDVSHLIPSQDVFAKIMSSYETMSLWIQPTQLSVASTYFI